MNMDMNDLEHFPTSDFPLATFLYASGVILEDIIDSDNPNDRQRKVFIFSKPSPDLITAFQSGKAQINVLAYNNAQNALKILLRGRH